MFIYYDITGGVSKRHHSQITEQTDALAGFNVKYVAAGFCTYGYQFLGYYRRVMNNIVIKNFYGFGIPIKTVPDDAFRVVDGIHPG